MYRILLVDDERPALNYLNTIVQKYLPDFEVAGTAEDGPSAWDFLQQQPVDVLVTDISMPGGMNGIDLAKKAREKFPTLHIVIVSGYAEFEYARGALQAGVDDYLLKPVSIAKSKEVMEKVKEALDEEQQLLKQKTLSSLLRKKDVSKEQVIRAFGASSYYFAVVRFGNLNENRQSRLSALPVGQLNQPGWLCYTGHDEQEWILLRSEKEVSGRFSVELKELLTQYSPEEIWTAIHEISPKPVRLLPAFLEKAFELMNSQLVIGMTQLLPVTTVPSRWNGTLPSAVIRQLSAHMLSASWRAVQELFLSLAVEWEKAKLPQVQVERLCDQLIFHVISGGSDSGKSRSEIDREAAGLYASAASVGELLAGLYSTLFGDASAHDKKISGEELCEYTLAYLRENYAMPLNIQTVCAKIGFSQTYLSRILRKYANTSINAYLTQCRMEAAKELLKNNPSMLLRDVAVTVGYEDQSYFNKIFRNETGMTPKQYVAQFSKSND